MSNHISVQHSLLDAWYREHHRWLVGWLRRKLESGSQADDLAQETFCRLLALPGGDLAALKTPRAYLTTTATRLLIDLSRRRKVEQAYLEALALTQADAQAISPEAQLALLQTLTLIASMLEGLAEKPRMAFMLSRLEHLGHAEIASQLGVSSSMVKQYIAAAMVHCYHIVHGELKP